MKIGRAGDIPAIGQALLRIVDEGETVAALGRRGRDHAMRYDCAGYAGALLDHGRDHDDLLRRRAGHTAEHRLGGGPGHAPDRRDAHHRRCVAGVE